MSSMRAASGMRFYAANYRLKENRHISADSEQERTAIEQEADEAKQGFETRLATYEKLISSAEDRQLFDTTRSDWAAYLAVSKDLFALSRQNLTGQAQEL